MIDANAWPAEQHAALPGDRGVGFGEGTQQLAESPLVGVGGVLLVAQEDDLVPEQGGPQFGHRGRFDVAADPDAADDGTDGAADLGHVDTPEVDVPEVGGPGLAGDGPGGTEGRVVLDLGHARAPFGVWGPGSGA